MDQCLSLWCAVIGQAIEDVQFCPEISKRAKGKYQLQKAEDARRIRSQAYHWLVRERVTTIGSLSWICFHFGMDPGSIRKKAKELYVAAELRAALD